MVFSRFIWSILSFVAAIVGTAIALGIFLQKPEFPMTISLLVLALILETAALLWYLTRIRRDLLKLVNALVNDDPSMQFSKVRRDPYFNAVHAGFNALISDFRLVRLDREAEQRFFEETVNHVQFGLVAYNENGAVRMINNAFLDLFINDIPENEEEVRKVSLDVVKDADFFKNDPIGDLNSCYKYRGSLTTPPYTETVTWLVIKRIMEASPEQIMYMNALEGDNARHIQATNDRAIIE